MGGVALSGDFFARSVHTIAPQLIGSTLLVDSVGGRIVEVEAYAPTDPASHSYGGLTPRNRSMFGPPGRAYVYRSYGVHWCLNFVCEEEGVGAAVLVRALEPTEGIEFMAERRGTRSIRLLCAGPGRLCQALAITGNHDGLPIDEAPFALAYAPSPSNVETGRRVGISRGTELLWRYVDTDSPFLSRKLKSLS